MKVIYTKMVADLFHVGHVHFLMQARSLGDRLVVHVVSDERVAAYKRPPIMTQAERAAVLGACKFVDEVRLEGPKEITAHFMKTNEFNIYVYGYSDLKEAEIKQRDCIDLEESNISIIPYLSGISTTELIKRIKER